MKSKFNRQVQRRFDWRNQSLFSFNGRFPDVGTGSFRVLVKNEQGQCQSECFLAAMLSGWLGSNQWLGRKMMMMVVREQQQQQIIVKL